MRINKLNFMIHNKKGAEDHTSDGSPESSLSATVVASEKFPLSTSFLTFASASGEFGFV